MSTLFISDLHLHEERPLVTEAFFSFLQTEARRAERLYILGDLFDAWIGDDDDRPLVTQVAQALKSITDHGCKIFFQHGNRDFLLGDSYAKRCGMTLLPEFHVLEVDIERWLLAHGDQFCTKDLAYQQFRTQVRNPLWQKELLSKTLSERRSIAKELREKSRDANSLKAEDIMDVTPAEIEKSLQIYQCCKLIHGHTHRPARHKIQLEGKAPVERIVLGDWDSTFWFLQHKDSALQLIQQALV
jgi:UDP-2,3-diacylglucosamine hydrolase